MGLYKIIGATYTLGQFIQYLVEEDLWKDQEMDRWTPDRMWVPIAMTDTLLTAEGGVVLRQRYANVNGTRISNNPPLQSVMHYQFGLMFPPPQPGASRWENHSYDDQPFAQMIEVQ